MQRLEVSGAVRPLYGSLGVKGLTFKCPARTFTQTYEKRFEDCMRKTGSQTPHGRDSRRRAILQWTVRREKKKGVSGLDSW